MTLRVSLRTWLSWLGLFSCAREGPGETLLAKPGVVDNSGLPAAKDNVVVSVSDFRGVEEDREDGTMLSVMVGVLAVPTVPSS